MCRSGIVVVSCVAVLAGGCAAPIVTARTAAGAPGMVREARADSAVARPRCDVRWRFVAPGMGRWCRGHPEEGAVVLGLTVAELAAAGATLAGHGADHPGVAMPLTAVQDLWIYDVGMSAIEEDLAARKRYAPQDDFAELVGAPFNPEVVFRPHVLLSIAAATAAAVLGPALLEEPGDAPGGDVNFFGYRLDPVLGYPAAAATGVAIFSHAAVAEEVLFRGVLQSRLARRYGENVGWALSSLAFGATHVFNAGDVKGPERREYLRVDVPFIIGLGGLLGMNYRWADYSLTAPVAVHFWFNLVIGAIDVARNPAGSGLSASFRIPL